MHTVQRPCGGAIAEGWSDLLELDPVVPGAVPSGSAGGGLPKIPDDRALVVDGCVEGERNLRGVSMTVPTLDQSTNQPNNQQTYA